MWRVKERRRPFSSQFLALCYYITIMNVEAGKPSFTLPPPYPTPLIYVSNPEE